MNLDTITDNLRDAIKGFLHVDWLSTAITIVVVLAVTAILSHFLTKLLQKALNVKNNPLPSSTIFINIGRVVVWTVGVCVILSSCFNVNVSAAITALGIGGIAISLGFQATISNLIGGLQISLTRLVVPGDNIRVGGEQGIVHDVTWRHTTISTVRGEQVIIPNSVINTEALVKLPPVNAVRIGVVVTPSGKSLEETTKLMTKAVSDEVGKIAVLEADPQIEYSEITDYGYRGALTFSVAEGASVGKVKDVALKAIAEYAHANFSGKAANAASTGKDSSSK